MITERLEFGGCREFFHW